MSDFRTTHPVSRSEATRILLLVQNDANREQLASWLSAEYDVFTADGASLPDLEFDLCLVDEPAFERCADRLARSKRAAAPTFLPYLLVSPDRTEQAFDQDAWELVDEIVSVPTHKRTLGNRLDNLLERRELSKRQTSDLEQQRELFRKVFESSNDAIVVVDPDRDVVYECNPQACELFGYSRAELLSMAPAELHADDAAFRSFLETVLEDGHGWTTAITCRTSAGESLDAELSASTVEIGDRPHVLASIRDVTTRNEQRRVLNNLHDVTVDLMEGTTRQEIADVTVRAAQDVFGYDIAGVRLLDTSTDPETLELVAATPEVHEHLASDPVGYDVGESVVGEAFARGEPVVVDELHARTTPVDYGPLRSAMCFPLGSHGVLSIGATTTGAFSDVRLDLPQILATNATSTLTRAEREESLREQNEYLSGLFGNTTDCIVDVTFVDGVPRVRDVNSRFEEVFGYENAEIRGESLTDLVVPPDERAQSRSLVERALAGERVQTEVRRDTATGRRDFFVRVVPIQQQSAGLGAYVVYTDITQRKRRDQQLQVLNRVLRHNIRNKLNIVSGVLERSLEEGNDVSESLARSGLTAADELLNLCETARSLSPEARPDNNSPAMTLREIVDHTVGSLEREHPDADISANVATECIVAGTVQLGRALRELCENAVEHAERSAPSVRIVADSDPDERGWVRVTVTDTGPGIPDDQKAVLQKGEETELEHGNGLGLWTVQWIVTNAGGELTIEDRDGGGSVVTMRVPITEPETASETEVNAGDLAP